MRSGSWARSPSTNVLRGKMLQGRPRAQQEAGGAERTSTPTPTLQNRAKSVKYTRKSISLANPVPRTTPWRLGLSWKCRNQPLGGESDLGLMSKNTKRGLYPLENPLDLPFLCFRPQVQLQTRTKRDPWSPDGHVLSRRTPRDQGGLLGFAGNCEGWPQWAGQCWPWNGSGLC